MQQMLLYFKNEIEKKYSKKIALKIKFVPVSLNTCLGMYYIPCGVFLHKLFSLYAEKQIKRKMVSHKRKICADILDDYKYLKT